MTRYTISTLVEETLGALSGHTLDQPQATWLTNAITDTELSINVEHADQISRGVIEIGDELVFVTTQEGEAFTVAPFGRGYQGTEAVAHDVNEMVTVTPRFPRYRIRETINDVIEGTYPMLFGVDTHEFTPTGVQVSYDLPTDVEQVLTVKQGIVGPSQFERTFKRWGVNRDGAVPTLEIFEYLELTKPVRVTYTKKPSRLTTAQEFTDSGLAGSAWPAVKNGVLFHILAPQDSGTAGLNSVKASEAKGRRTTSSTEIARGFYAAYQQLLIEERNRLLAEHEITFNKEYL